MPISDETLGTLRQIPNVQVSEGAPLARYTRFGLGGPAWAVVETSLRESLVRALAALRASGLPYTVLGSGANVVAADEGYRGVVLRFTASRIWTEETLVTAEAGADLQQVVDFAIAHGLSGLETLAGVPGSLGAAVYGNAGAYGRSLADAVEEVTFLDGECVRAFGAAECEFRYRESVFKRRKHWIVLSATLALARADSAALRGAADEILAVRNAKFPPTMKCAGSVFKNMLAADLPPALAASLPPEAVREGKIPAAYFLERAGAKGLSRGGIHVADYHANLLYNDGGGTAREFRDLAAELKSRVRERFGLEIEEEVQYVGFEDRLTPPART